MVGETGVVVLPLIKRRLSLIFAKDNDNVIGEGHCGTPLNQQTVKFVFGSGQNLGRSFNKP